jgi:hypothetical protein
MDEGKSFEKVEPKNMEYLKKTFSINTFNTKKIHHWISDAEIIDAKYKINQDGTVEWENGTWEYGIWSDGTWSDGTWENGTWEDGTWEDGTWKNGWIFDIARKGNFQPDWKWAMSYVESPISPKEYFAS